MLLSELGVPAALIEQERFAMAQASWAKTESRVLRGVLTEQAGRAAAILDRGGHMPTADLTRLVAQTIVKRQVPSELTRQAFGLEARSRRDRDDAVAEPAFDARGELTRRGLVPLALRPRGEWRPDEAVWGEAGEPLPRWARAIIERGPRPRSKWSRGQDLSRPILYKLLEADVRCLDAHAHLCNFTAPQPIESVARFVTRLWVT